MARDSSLAALADFDKATLKKSETCEKNPLPPAEAIAQEMEHMKFKVSISPPSSFYSVFSSRMADPEPGLSCRIRIGIFPSDPDPVKKVGFRKQFSNLVRTYQSSVFYFHSLCLQKQSRISVSASPVKKCSVTQVFLLKNLFTQKIIFGLDPVLLLKILCTPLIRAYYSYLCVN